MDANHAGQWLTNAAQGRGITTYQGLAVALSVEFGAPIGSTSAYRWWLGHRLVPRRYWAALSAVLDVSLDEVALRASGFDPVEASA